MHIFQNIFLYKGGNYLPHLTMCNLNPFSDHTSTTMEGFPSLEEYFNKLKEQLVCNDCSQEEMEEMKEIYSELKSQQGYAIYIGLKNASKLR